MSKPEDYLTSLVISKEYAIAVSNTDDKAINFEKGLDMIDNERIEKGYDWMSDISIPEFPSQMLTQLSIDVSQYFSSRDYVESYLQDDSQEALAASDTDKELINRTLNQRHLRYYHKYVRGRFINYLNGSVIGLCWWERKSHQMQNGTEEVTTIREGFEDSEIPLTDTVEEPVFEEVIDMDRFNFELVDPRNVFMDNNYVYSIQDKGWITILDEKNLQYYMGLKDSPDYINIDKVIKHYSKTVTTTQTEAANRSYNKDDNYQKANTPANKNTDRFRRFGSYWAVVTERDEAGVPIKAKIGTDNEGEPLDNAEWIEVLVEVAKNGSTEFLVRFQPTPFIDASNQPYKPVIRGLCYIHPTKDDGLSDVVYAKDLQQGIDDTLNVSNDRVMLATLPTLVGTEASLSDNSSIYFEPEHVIQEMEQGDIREIQISDNIGGALQQIGLLTSKMQQVTAIYPTTMGQLPGESTTKATAIAESSTRSNTRSNYKALTFENTFLGELYWMIRHMTWRFASPETGVALMGEKVYNFDPTKDYYHKPVSQAIETEQSKEAKINRYTQILGYITQIGHPDAVKIVNHILLRIYTLMGDEYVSVMNTLLDPKKPITSGSDQQEDNSTPASNQQGIPQSSIEQSTREAFNG